MEFVRFEGSAALHWTCRKMTARGANTIKATEAGWLRIETAVQASKSTNGNVPNQNVNGLDHRLQSFVYIKYILLDLIEGGTSEQLPFVWRRACIGRERPTCLGPCYAPSEEKIHPDHAYDSSLAEEATAMKNIFTLVSGANQKFYDVYLYSKKKDEYIYNKRLSNVPCLDVDQNNKQLVGQCFHESSCENWEEHYSVSQKGNISLVERKGTYCDPSGGQGCIYIDRFRNGKKVSSKTLPMDNQSDN